MTAVLALLALQVVWALASPQASSKDPHPTAQPRAPTASPTFYSRNFPRALVAPRSLAASQAALRVVVNPYPQGPPIKPHQFICQTAHYSGPERLSDSLCRIICEQKCYWAYSIETMRDCLIADHALGCQYDDVTSEWGNGGIAPSQYCMDGLKSVHFVLDKNSFVGDLRDASNVSVFATVTAQEVEACNRLAEASVAIRPGILHTQAGGGFCSDEGEDNWWYNATKVWPYKYTGKASYFNETLEVDITEGMKLLIERFNAGNDLEPPITVSINSPYCIGSPSAERLAGLALKKTMLNPITF